MKHAATSLGRLMALAALLMLSFSVPVAAAKTPPTAVDGVLDLSAWNLEASGSVRLDGTWHFFWGRLLTPEDFTIGNPVPDGLLGMPGTWKGYRLNGQALPGTGYATLRLRILLPANGEELALYIPNLLTAYRLWVNGELSASAGHVGTDRESSIPQFSTTIVPLNANGGVLDLVLQISNFAHREAGPQQSLELGSGTHLPAQKNRTAVAQAALLGGMGFLGVHYILLYMMGRESVAYLYFGLFFAILSLRTLVDFGLILNSMPPGPWWEVRYRALFLCAGALLAVAIRAIRSMFPDEEIPRVSAILFAVGTVASALPLVASAYITTRLMNAYHLSSLGTVAYALLVGIRAARNGRPNAWPFLVAILGMGLGLSIELLRFQRISYVPSTIHWLTLSILILFQVLLHTLNHGRLAAANSVLTMTLQERLEELRASRRLLAAQQEHQNRTIAEFLHSRVQTRLLVIWHHLKQVGDHLLPDQQQAAQVLTTARLQLEEVREQDIRLASHLLHPTAITVGLVPALRTLASEYAGHFRTQVQASAAVGALDNVKNNRVPESVRLAAYRVAAEGLTNVVAHAEASEVRIDLALTDAGDLMLTVEDNGKGFAPEQATFGLGLRTIAARISECSGTWSVRSQPGEGTRLQAVIPLEPTDSLV